MLRFAVLFVVAAACASAQVPIPNFPQGCEVIKFADGAKVSYLDAERKELSIRDGSLCTRYAPYGWEETLELQLGEGASAYRELIEKAVELWNEAVTAPGRKPLITISNKRVTNYRLPSSFWEDTYYHSDALGDGENVIYFMSSSEDDARRGVTYVWWRTENTERLIEADVFINTWPEEEFGRNNLSITRLLTDWDGTNGMYARINGSFQIILHEIGHAIGLAHIPVKGNIMSRDYMPRVVDQWAATATMFKIDNSHLYPGQIPFLYPHEFTHPYEVIHELGRRARKEQKFFTDHARLGEQEKMALTCIYEY